MTDNEIYQQYTFSYRDEDTDIDIKLNETDYRMLSWPYILSKVIRFLEMTHGYNISDKVQIKYSQHIDTDIDWTGEFFDVPEEDTEEDEEKAGLTE